jgi:phosphohistidine phosphatase
MQILLVRHGQAVETAPGLGDTGRWLTAKGRKTTRKVARWLDKNDRRRPTAIWTSPLVRAVQTAEIVAARVGFEGEIKVVSELSPGRDPGDLVKLLAAAPPDGVLALVGHEPSLSLIANALAGEAVVESLRKSGVLGLAWDGTKGTPRFLLDPAEMKAKKRFGATAPAAPEAAGDEG